MESGKEHSMAIEWVAPWVAPWVARWEVSLEGRLGNYLAIEKDQEWAIPTERGWVSLTEIKREECSVGCWGFSKANRSEYKKGSS